MAYPNIIQQISSKLPLSGGDISGDLVFCNTTNTLNHQICVNNNSSYLEFYGGTNNNSSILQLYGNEYTANEKHKASVRILTGITNEYSRKELLLKPDGTFTWGGNNVITSGGLITGNLTWEHGIIRDQGNNFEFIGDKDNINNCAFISCRSVYNPTQPGWFYFGARTQEQTSIGICKPDGTFTWRNINHTQWMMPDYNKTHPTSLPTHPISSKAIFTAPFDGWLFIHANRTTAGHTLHFQFNSSSCVRQFPAFSTEYCDIFHPMKKNDYVHVWTDNYNNANTWVITNQMFYGCQGNP